ncbi:MAG: hypothetical protein AAFP90_20875, partial [Planctomycetota bacterium]
LEKGLPLMEKARTNYLNSSRAPVGREATYFFAYYKRYLIPKMTQVSELDKLGERSQRLLEDLAASKRVRSPVAATLHRDTRTGLTALATRNYHPFVRVTATVMLGQLDTSPGIGNRPPKVDASAFKTLTDIHADPKSLPVQRDAALLGIHRYLENTPNVPKIQFFDSLRTRLIGQLDAESNQRDPMAAAYLKRHLVQCVDWLSTEPEQRSEVAKQLAKISTDDSQPLMLTSYAAQHLGAMDASALKSANPKIRQMGDKWAAMLIANYQSEIDRLDSLGPVKPATSQPSSKLPDLSKPSSSKKKRSNNLNMGGPDMGTGDGGYGGGDDMTSMMDGMDGLTGMGGDSNLMDDDSSNFGGGMGGMMGGLGGGLGGSKEKKVYKPQLPEVEMSRRSVGAVLQRLKSGFLGDADIKIAGLKAAVSDADGKIEDQVTEEYIAAWTEMADDLFKNTHDRDLNQRDEYRTMLEEQIERVEEFLEDYGTLSPVQAAADAAFDDDANQADNA